MKKLLPILLMVTFFGLARSQDISTVSIVDEITADSVNIIIQPQELEDRVSSSCQLHEQSELSFNPGVRLGYRIQVFSDGNQATSREQANKLLRIVQSRFPSHRSNLEFKSPYWKVKLGDFRDKAAAEEVMQQVKNVMPSSYRKGVRVIKDAIIIR